MYLNFHMDINICVMRYSNVCLQWTKPMMPAVDGTMVHLPSIFACCQCSYFLLSFFPKKKVQFNFVTHLSLLFVYLLYFKITMDNPIIFFLLEFLEISCLSNLNCHYLLLMWVGLASLYNVFILCNCHYLFLIFFIKIF